MCVTTFSSHTNAIKAWGAGGYATYVLQMRKPQNQIGK